MLRWPNRVPVLGQTCDLFQTPIQIIQNFFIVPSPECLASFCGFFKSAALNSALSFANCAFFWFHSTSYKLWGNLRTPPRGMVHCRQIRVPQVPWVCPWAPWYRRPCSHSSPSLRHPSVPCRESDHDPSHWPWSSSVLKQRVRLSFHRDPVVWNEWVMFKMLDLDLRRSTKVAW